MSKAPCDKCGQLLQLYLDGELNEGELHETEVHLDECGYCRRVYRFERAFRAYLRSTLSDEPISPELKNKLAALRSGAQSSDRP